MASDALPLTITRDPGVHVRYRDILLGNTTVWVMMPVSYGHQYVKISVSPAKAAAVDEIIT